MLLGIQAVSSMTSRSSQHLGQEKAKLVKKVTELASCGTMTDEKHVKVDPTQPEKFLFLEVDKFFECMQKEEKTYWEDRKDTSSWDMREASVYSSEYKQLWEKKMKGSQELLSRMSQELCQNTASFPTHSGTECTFVKKVRHYLGTPESTGALVQKLPGAKMRRVGMAAWAMKCDFKNEMVDESVRKDIPQENKEKTPFQLMEKILMTQLGNEGNCALESA